ncbi:MAG: hypothetical protein IPN33_06430 [Saprospiraceae bacterium]|nr:hypothetical protein [Saprospiraceae bacterium]
MNDKLLLQTENKLFQDIKALVLQARKNAFRAVDSERVFLNWHIGQRILVEVLKHQRAEFGQKVIKI